MEWVVAGVVGLLTGFVGPLVAPWAQWRVSEAKDRTAARRELIAGGRALHVEHLRRWDSNDYMTDEERLNDPRMVAVWSSLDDEVRQRLTRKPDTAFQVEDHRAFREDLDRLEKKWKLV